MEYPYYDHSVGKRKRGDGDFTGNNRGGKGHSIARRFPNTELYQTTDPCDLKVEGMALPSIFMYVRCPAVDKAACPCCCDRRVAHIDSMIVAVDGACPGNGANPTESSCGVYVGPDNRRKISIPMPDYEVQHESTCRASCGLHGSRGMPILDHMRRPVVRRNGSDLLQTIV